MKNIKIIFFATIVLGLASCSPRVLPSAEVEQTGSSKGTISVRSLGYAKKSKDVLKDAEARAFQTLLFRGLPDGKMSSPLVANESQALNTHHTFFNDFFTLQGYRNYLISSTAITPAAKDKNTGLHQGLAEVTINLAALRRKLEQEKIIRKFGL